jgi:hypothetical protein
MADGIDPIKALVTTVTSHKETFQWTIIFLNFMQVKSLHWLWIRHGLQNHWAQPASLAWWNILRQCNLLLRLFVRRKTKVKSSWTWSLWLMSFWKWAFQSLWLILKDSGNGLQCWIRNFNHNISDHYNISRHGVRGGNRGEHTFDVIIVTVMHIDFALPGSWDFLRRAAHAQALQGQSRLPSVTFSGSLRASRVCCIVRACAVWTRKAALARAACSARLSAFAARAGIAAWSTCCRKNGALKPGFSTEPTVSVSVTDRNGSVRFGASLS